MNLKALAAEATRSDGIIEFVPQVGDFVGAQEPLFRLYGGARAVDASKLRAAVAFGSERTMEQVRLRNVCRSKMPSGFVRSTQGPLMPIVVKSTLHLC